jgi:hypothetical protein
MQLDFAVSDSPLIECSRLSPNMKSNEGHPVSFRLRLAVLFPSLLLFLIACATPAIELLKNGVEPHSWYGVEALGLGVLGVFIGQFGWFANPLLLLSYVLVLFRRFIAASIFALVAVAVATHSFSLFHQHIPADEGDVNHLDAKAFGIGFYFWAASLLAAVLVPLLASFVLKRRAVSDTIPEVMS